MLLLSYGIHPPNTVVFIIMLRRYKLIRTLGAGSFGRVMLAHLDNDTNKKPFAIKILMKEKVVKMKQVRYVMFLP